MEHGPFAHDDHDRARLQAALAHAVAVVEPQPDAPEDRVLRWAIEHHRPAFLIGQPEADYGTAVRRLERPADLDWMVQAVTGEAA
jgi:hypothetical protein